MCFQPDIFQQLKEDPTKVKEMVKKSGECRFCHSLLRVRPKYLDKRLGELAWNIYKAVKGNESRSFRGDEVFISYKDICDFQKLGYFKIIEKSGHCRWRLTYKGKRFLEGKVSLPCRVFVLNNRVVAEEEQQVTIDKLEPRWQSEHLDFVLDYYPQKSLAI